VLDAGGRDTTKAGDYATVLRLTIDNLFDKRLRRDVRIRRRHPVPGYAAHRAVVRHRQFPRLSVYA
jgi:hypothetical protein